MSDESVLDEQQEDKNWKVKLQNFQSIVNGEITIPAGLTLITGDSNQGKTAFFRGVDCSLFNTGTDDIVKAGCKIAGVTISNGEHEMIYCRNAQGKNEKTAYQFDGGTIQKKVGRSQLPEVLKMFGIREVRMQNGVKMKLNFWYQGDRPFLMDKTSGQLYEFLSLSSCDKYVKVLKQMVTDIKIQEAEINSSNVKIDTLKVINNRKQDYVDSNIGFDEVYKKVIVSSNEARKLNKNIEVLEDIYTTSKDIDDTKDKIASITDKISVIDIDDITDKFNRMGEINNLYSSMYSALCDIKALKSEIETDRDKLKEVTKKHKELSSIEKSIATKIKVLDDNEKFIGLYEQAEDCVKCLKEVDVLKNRIILLEGNKIDIDSIEEQVISIESMEKDYNTLVSVISDLKSIRSDINELSDNINTTKEKLNSAERDLEDYKQKVGYCPFCGSVFNEKCTH